MGRDLHLTTSDADLHVFELLYISSLGHADVVGSPEPFAQVPVSDPGPRVRYERLLLDKGADGAWLKRVAAHLEALDAWIATHPDGYWSTS